MYSLTISGGGGDPVHSRPGWGPGRGIFSDYSEVIAEKTEICTRVSEWSTGEYGTSTCPATVSHDPRVQFGCIWVKDMTHGTGESPSHENLTISTFFDLKKVYIM